MSAQRLKQVLMGIGLLTVIGVLAMVGLVAYVWWDTRTEMAGIDTDVDVDTDAEFDVDGAGEEAGTDAEVPE
jgi:hypothetical protein